MGRIPDTVSFSKARGVLGGALLRQPPMRAMVDKEQLEPIRPPAGHCSAAAGCNCSALPYGVLAEAAPILCAGVTTYKAFFGGHSRGYFRVLTPLSDQLVTTSNLFQLWH